MKLFTNHLRTWLARLFVRRFSDITSYAPIANIVSRYVNLGYVVPGYTSDALLSDTANSVMIPDFSYFYVFAGANTTATPVNSIQGSHYEIYDHMIFGKRATADDVSLMIDRNEWTANTVYDIYDNTDPCLHLRDFFVYTEEGSDYHVFKCIDNNNGAPSTSAPLLSEARTTDSYYKTGDDYVWMYMYTIPNTTFKKFATKDFIPLTQTVSDYPPALGSVQSVIVTEQGLYYNTKLTGTVKTTRYNSSNKIITVATSGNDLFSYTNYYAGCSIYFTSGPGKGQLRTIVASSIVGNDRVLEFDSPLLVDITADTQFEIGPGVAITGDGTGAQARAIVNDLGQITQIEVVTRGSGYTYANATTTSNAGYFSGNTLTQTPATATAKVIISPPYGHGRDLINELFADKVCISVDFIGDVHPLSSYTQYGLIVNPLFTNVTITLSTVVGFVVGEVIAQELSSTYGVIKAIDSVNNTITLSNVKGAFIPGESCFGVNSKTTAIITATSSAGDSFVIGDLVDNSGEILLIRNEPFVTTRDVSQTERIKLIIDF